jgi:predicted alpha/beta superfamily hydrolase
MITQVSILATEVRSIPSRNIKDGYSVSVALPYSYYSEPKQDYATIYLIDPHLYFGMVTEMTRVMSMGGNFPETIVVGIGYPIDMSASMDESFNQIQSRRAKDLTPGIDREFEKELEAELKKKTITTGGAENFLTFIRTKLIPEIESNYRVKSGQRILAGHSLGGLFTLYTLFSQPGLFTGYVACSPSLWYGNNSIFNDEADFAQQHEQLPVKLYLGVGGLEEKTDSPMISNLYRFAALISSRSYKELSLTRQIIENCGHCATPAPSFQSGLQAVLD